MGNADLARMSRRGTACRAHGASPGNRVVVPGRSVRDGKCSGGGGCRWTYAVRDVWTGSAAAMRTEAGFALSSHPCGPIRASADRVL